MILTKRHLQLLLHLYEKSRQLTDPLEVLSDDADIDYFVQLRYMGLVRKEGDYYHITYPGILLAEAWREAELSGKAPDGAEWPDNYRWVGSTVLNMLHVARKAQGKVNDIMQPVLAPRGLARNGMLTPLGWKVYDAFMAAHPDFEISPGMQEAIKRMPAGPSPRRNLILSEVEGALLLDMEAQRLIAFSAPAGEYYALTGLGQQLQAALKTGAFVRTVTTEYLDAVRAIDAGEAVDASLRQELLSQGVITEDSRLLPAGKHLLTVARIYSGENVVAPFSIDIDEVELDVLHAMAVIEQKHRTNPEELPTKDRIRREVIDRKVVQARKMLEKYGRRLKELPQVKQHLLKDFQEIRNVQAWFDKYYDFDTALFGLEGYGLIAPRLSEEKKLFYQITEAGHQVLEEQRPRQREIPAEAVKAITLSRLQIFAPDGRWMHKATAAGLIENAPTPSGRFYARLAYRPKTINLSEYGLKVLQKIPYTTGMYYEDLQKELPEFSASQLIQLVEKLDARALVHMYPNELVALTPAGRLVKQATAALGGHFKYPVNPNVINVLEKLREVGTLYVKERKVRILPENWKKALKLLQMDVQTFQDTLEMLHHARYVSKTGITEAGLLLLEANDLIRRLSRGWEEIEV